MQEHARACKAAKTITHSVKGGKKSMINIVHKASEQINNSKFLASYDPYEADGIRDSIIDLFVDLFNAEFSSLFDEESFREACDYGSTRYYDPNYGKTRLVIVSSKR
jgi:hypothetical protein